MSNIHTFRVVPNLPEKLRPLAELARNLWWTWNPETAHLFRRLDPEIWEDSRHNPVELLGSLSQERLVTLANDDAVLAGMDRAIGLMNDYLQRASWFGKSYGDAQDFQVAYFGAEFGLHESLPIYSGGLGVLAGDHLKSASDLGVPLVGVGLLYRMGFFRQVLSRDGWQQENHPAYDFDRLPLQPETVDGSPCRVPVELGEETVLAQVWRVQVGRVPLLLLDTDLPENSIEGRRLTDELYGGDQRHRIRQEIVLGIGGVRALRKLGYGPTVYHLNEGHSAFLAIERIRRRIEEEGLSFDEALEAVRSSSVFTTHTPVPAGNDVFSEDLMREHFLHLCPRLGISIERLVAMGRSRPEVKDEPFCMTVLALRTSSQANGVSRLHASVSREMWKDLYPNVPVDEIPIDHVTNGIHIPSWYSREVAMLYTRYLGPRWQEDPKDRQVWDRVEKIPDAELWRARDRLRGFLVTFARRRLAEQLERRGMPGSIVGAAEEVLDPDALTICFARRFAVYKRATLILRDPKRLERLLNDPERPVQLLFAGKAHPADLPGKQIMREIVHLAAEPRFRNRIVLLEDYDIDVARMLVQGADVWLNTPRRPLEASGTSGMKSVVSGGIHLSVLDGWWDEAYTPESGWAIGNGDAYESEETQDQIESAALYDLLEHEVIPLFFDRGNDELPRGWIDRIKSSMRRHCPVFNTNRMVGEYTRRYYLPAHERFLRVGLGGVSGARGIASWRRRMNEAWSDVDVVRLVADPGDHPVGGKLRVEVEVRLGGLEPDDVIVEAVHGDVGIGDTLQDTERCTLEVTGRQEDRFLYAGEIPCMRTGRRGLTVRVRPVPRLNRDNPFDAGLLTWWEGRESKVGIAQQTVR